VPETGPRHVDPEYGMRIMSPYIVAVPVRETSHAVTPGPVAPAVARTGTVVGLAALSSPHAEPEAVRLPAQRAKKMPEIIVAVWLVTRHSKSLQELAVEPVDVALVQVPT
jgi:hypothetical protein